MAAPTSGRPVKRPGGSIRAKLALIAASVCLLVFAASADAQPHGSCTSQQFRSAARQAMQPWYQPITGRWRLRRLAACSQNERTLGQMRRIRSRLLAGRHDAVDTYRRLTPYGRWAIPSYIVACESGGSWSAYNSSGAVGPYQLLGWGAPFPALTMQEKMQHHRIAHDLWNGGAGAGNWVCA